MPNKRPVVYWDSCVFIDRLQETGDQVELLHQLTDLAEKGGLLIVTSTLTIAEVIRLDNPDLMPWEELQKVHTYFFEHDWISLRTPDRHVTEEAARLRQGYGLKTVDAVQLATALSVHLTMGVTDD